MLHRFLPQSIRKPILSALRARRESQIGGDTFVRAGHFYSPLPEVSQFSSPGHPVFDASLRELPGVDLNRDSQIELLDSLAPEFNAFPWNPDEPNATCDYRFHFDQEFFREGDALILFSLLRSLRPKNIIEVGSGFSSALMLDTADMLPDWEPTFTFIEPFPERLNLLLRDRDYHRCGIIDQQVQEVPISSFEQLTTGDLLFIDSSHVSKIGSDVNFLLFEVLPRLQPGVLVHVHDIFWPFEYPHSWIQQGRAWNESYMLRAFLCGNRSFEIVFWNSWAGLALQNVMERVCPIFSRNTGGSIYLRKTKLAAD